MRVRKPWRPRPAVNSSRRTVNIPLLRRRFVVEPVSTTQFNWALIDLQSKITEFAAVLS
jgi:hypothetical protein